MRVALPDVPAEVRAVRRAALAGMTAAVLFVTVFSVYGGMLPGYSANSMFVSELSLAPYGWIQILNFVLTGALVFVFGRGLGAYSRTGAAAQTGPILVQILGLSLFMSGPFTTDSLVPSDAASTHGLIHGLFGALFFALAPVTCFVFAHRWRTDSAWRPLTGWTLAVGLVLTMSVVLLKISEQPSSALFEWKGLVQRVFLVTFMAWLFMFAARLRRLTAARRFVGTA